MWSLTNKYFSFIIYYFTWLHLHALLYFLWFSFSWKFLFYYPVHLKESVASYKIICSWLELIIGALWPQAAIYRICILLYIEIWLYRVSCWSLLKSLGLHFASLSLTPLMPYAKVPPHKTLVRFHVFWAHINTPQNIRNRARLTSLSGPNNVMQLRNVFLFCWCTLWIF